MRFSIAKDALNGTEGVLDCLDAILGRVEDTIHELEILDADLLNDSSWYQSSRPERRKLLEEIAAASLRQSKKTSGPHVQRIEVFDPATAESARQTSHTPLEILLENADSDGALVTAALRVLACAETKRLCFHLPSTLTIPAIEFNSRGGHGELRKFIEAKIENSLANGRRLRCLVVADSDGEFIGDVKDYAQDIRDVCAHSNIPCPPLTQRTAENYIPDEIWEAWSAGIENTAKKPIVDALKRLSADQRDYIRMDNGNKEPWNRNVPPAQALFASVSDADYELLTNARLKGKAEGMTIHAMNTYASALTVSALRVRDRAGDLTTLVKQIEDEL